MLSVGAISGTQYPLPVLTGEATDALTAWYDNGRFEELNHPYGHCVAPPMPVRRVGSLVWPIVGASRFAYGVFAIDAYTLSLLRADLAGGNTVTVDIDDGTDSDTKTMYLLASRPVSRCDADDTSATEPPPVDDLWLITLVDQRWYWVHTSGTGQTGTYVPSSWSDLFVKLFGHLSVSYSIDTINSAYGTAVGDRWTGGNTQNTPTAYLLDDAAQCLGMRVVVVDSVTVQTPSAANKTTATDWLALQTVGAGGSIDDDERLNGVPKQVYAAWQDDSTQTVDQPTGLDGFSLAAWIDMPATASGTQRTNALTQWAADWYAWQSVPFEGTVDSFDVVAQSGFLASFERFHSAETGYTRFSTPLAYSVITNCLWLCPGESPTVAATGFHARLTTSSGGGSVWKWVALKLSSGAYVDDGSESATFSAVPLPFEDTDATVRSPRAGQHVWMIPSKQAGKYQFIHLNIADPLFRGVIESNNTTVQNQASTANRIWQSRNFVGTHNGLAWGSVQANNNGSGGVSSLLELRRMAGYNSSPGAQPTLDSTAGGLGIRVYNNSGSGANDTQVDLEIITNDAGTGVHSTLAFTTDTGLSDDRGIAAFDGTVQPFWLRSQGAPFPGVILNAGSSQPRFAYWARQQTSGITGLTTTGGNPTVTAYYMCVGQIAFVTVVIVPHASGGTTASIAGTTVLPVYPDFSVQFPGVCTAASQTSKLGLGVGAITPATGGTFGGLWFPAWAATTDTIVVTATYVFGLDGTTFPIA